MQRSKNPLARGKEVTDRFFGSSFTRCVEYLICPMKFLLLNKSTTGFFLLVATRTKGGGLQELNTSTWPLTEQFDFINPFAQVVNSMESEGRRPQNVI